MKLLLVLGSVRESRAGIKVYEWAKSHLEQNSDIQLIEADLAKIELPLEMESTIPSGVENFEYENEHTKKWSKMVRESDAVLIVSPEYNHSVSAALKNAFDHLYSEWQDKPVGVVGYGTRGAQDAIKHIEWISNFLKFKVVDARVMIPKIWEAFDENNRLKNEDEHLENLHQTIRSLSVA